MIIEEQKLSILRDQYQLDIQSSALNISRIFKFTSSNFDAKDLGFYSAWGPLIKNIHKDILNHGYHKTIR